MAETVTTPIDVSNRIIELKKEKSKMLIAYKQLKRMNIDPDMFIDIRNKIINRMNEITIILIDCGEDLTN